MPPPSLFSSTTTSGSPSREAASRPPRSWSNATSPMSSDHRAGARRRRAERGRHRPVDAVGPTVGEHARLGLARGEEGLDVAHRHRGGDEQGREGGQADADLCDHARLAELVAERRRDALGGGAVGRAPVGQRALRTPRARPPSWRIPTRSATASSVAAGSAASTVRDDGVGVLPGAVGVERRAGPRRRRRPARRAAAWRSAGRRRARRPRARGPRRSARSAAARRSARSPPDRGARRTAGRRAAEGRRPAANRATAAGSSRWRSSRPGDDHDPRVRAAISSASCAIDGRRTGAPPPADA